MLHLFMWLPQHIVDSNHAVVTVVLRSVVRLVLHCMPQKLNTFYLAVANLQDLLRGSVDFL